MPHDVYDFYPDLIIFHDFGGQENYTKIIEEIRQNTTAEILMQSYFPTWFPVDGDPADEAGQNAKLPCEVVDVRRPWYEYLKTNKLRAAALLRDGAHLNDQGNYLLAGITKRHLRYDPSLPQPDNPVRSVRVSDADWKDGVLRLEFTGNRVEISVPKEARTRCG